MGLGQYFVQGPLSAQKALQAEKRETFEKGPTRATKRVLKKPHTYKPSPALSIRLSLCPFSQCTDTRKMEEEVAETEVESQVNPITFSLF